MRLADEQGILLIAEAPAVSINFDHVAEGSKLLANHENALAELIARDRNCPSVIMWSVANEATTNRPDAVPYFSKLAAATRALDPTRPVTMVTCKVDDDLVMGAFDVVAVNFYPGWFVLAASLFSSLGEAAPADARPRTFRLPPPAAPPRPLRGRSGFPAAPPRPRRPRYHLPGMGTGEPYAAQKADMRRALTTLHEKFQKPVLVAEFGADALAGLHSLPAEQWSEEYQADLVLALIDEIRTLDFVVGEHVWNFADFRTAQNFPRVGGNKKGAFTRDRQPKMVAHLLRRKWAEKRYPDHPTNST